MFIPAKGHFLFIVERLCENRATKAQANVPRRRLHRRRQEEEGQRDDRVYGQQHRAFQPVRFAVE